MCLILFPYRMFHGPQVQLSMVKCNPKILSRKFQEWITCNFKWCDVQFAEVHDGRTHMTEGLTGCIPYIVWYTGERNDSHPGHHMLGLIHLQCYIKTVSPWVWVVPAPRGYLESDGRDRKKSLLVFVTHCLLLCFFTAVLPSAHHKQFVLCNAAADYELKPLGITSQINISSFKKCWIFCLSNKISNYNNI